jgi:hypothetical protein
MPEKRGGSFLMAPALHPTSNRSQCNQSACLPKRHGDWNLTTGVTCVRNSTVGGENREICGAEIAPRQASSGNVARTLEAQAWPTETVLVGWDPRFSRATDGLADTEARNPQQIARVEYSRSAVDLKARQALMLVGASGLSYHEAAGVGGCPLGTMKSRVSRASPVCWRSTVRTTLNQTVFSAAIGSGDRVPTQTWSFIVRCRALTIEVESGAVGLLKAVATAAAGLAGSPLWRRRRVIDCASVIWRLRHLSLDSWQCRYN